MKTFFGKLGAVLRRTWVWSLLLVLLLAVVVWFVGPLLAVDDYRFWESSTARLLIWIDDVILRNLEKPYHR